MVRFSTILFPINSSGRSVATAPYVAALADRFKSHVLTVHASDDPAAADEPALAAKVRRIIGPERTRHITRLGKPAEAIASVARDESVDVIVMPTRGISPLRRFWDPSVTASVVSEVECPVITCTEEWDRWAGRAISTVLCATALGPDSNRVLQWATWLAKSLMADLSVVHADARLEPTPGSLCDGEWRLWIRRAVRDQLKRSVQEAGAEEADLWIEGGQPATAIAQVAGQLRADLVVVGRSPSTGVFRRAQSKCYDIALEALCPVVIV